MSENARRRQYLEEQIREVLSHDPPSPENAGKIGHTELLHELSVYHEELEFQNEELRATQIELHAIKERYADLFDHAPYGYLVFDKDYRIQLVNDTLAEMIGSTPRALTGLSLTRCVAPESQDALYFHLQAIDELGAPQTTELLLLQQDGRRFPARVQSLPDYHSGSLYTRMAVMDISKEHAALQALKASEERYRLLIEMADDIVFVCALDDSGDPECVVEMNNAACRQIGYSHDELLQMAPSQLVHGVLLNDEARQELARNRRTILDAQLRTRLGEAIPVEVHASRFDWHARPMLLMVARDISQRLQLEAERREIEQRQLEMQKWQSLGALAGGIAHDFNNLLTAIANELEVIQISASGEASIARHIQRAHGAVKRGTELTLQMLAYTGRTSLNMGATPPNPLIKQSVEMVRSYLPKTIQLQLMLLPTPPNILVDAGQIQQVLISLLTNAVEAIGERPGSIVVSARVHHFDTSMLKSSRVEPIPPEGDYFCIEVKDNGAGMEPETLRRLFDPFFSTHFAGRGLGMAAVHGIVRSHRGAIFVESSVGQGTTICLLLPLAQEKRSASTAAMHATADAQSRRSPSPIATVPSMPVMTKPDSVRVDRATPGSGSVDSGVVDSSTVDSDTVDSDTVDSNTVDSDTVVSNTIGSVLIVDDEETLREACSDVLTAFGYRTFVAASGEQAVQMIGKHGAEIDCALLDLTMPGMNGFDAFAAMRSLQPNLQVIVTSGHDAEDVIRDFPPQSVAGYIQKPYSMRQLHEELQRIIRAQPQSR